MVYDYFLSIEHNNDWACWSETVVAFNYDPEPSDSNLLVNLTVLFVC